MSCHIGYSPISLLKPMTDKAIIARGPIALFIDYENVHYGLVNQYNFKPEVGRLTSLILAEVAKEGNILIKKAYADWEKPEFDGVQASLKKAGIEPAYTLSKKTKKSGVQATWKDSADAVLLLDALQTVFERTDIDQFVIVTGDRAALDLVHRLTSRGKRVKICALESALAVELTDAVGPEHVISIEGLLGIEPAGLPRFSIGSPVASAGTDWTTIIRQFADLESRLPFVGLKLARDKYGFGQDVINQGIELGVFARYSVPNPGQRYPTTALKLDASCELVKEALKKP